MFEDRNVGSLKKIRIGHDGAGLGAGWHLKRVVVENLTTGQVVVFDVNRCVGVGGQAVCGVRARWSEWA